MLGGAGGVSGLGYVIGPGECKVVTLCYEGRLSSGVYTIKTVDGHEAAIKVKVRCVRSKLSLIYRTPN